MNKKASILISAMISIAMLISMAVPVIAQTEEDLGSPGITPDSPFYFLDRMFDGFQSAEARADEKASEVLSMAREGKLEHAQTALKHYESAMERRQSQSIRNENIAEEVAVQSTNHLIVLVNVLEIVPDQAKDAIRLAMEVSVKERDESLNTLKEHNSSRGERVARETLQRVMDEETSAESQEGLTRAFNSIDSIEYSEEYKRTR